MVRVHRRRLWHAALGGAISLFAHEAIGQGPQLAYRAPEACPSAEAFTTRVGLTLQRPLEAFERFGRFQVAIESAPEGYRLTVTSDLDGEQGTRTLTGPDCSSVADAGALFIAMALSNAMQRAELAERPAEPPARVTPPAPPAARPAVPPAPVEPADHSRASVALHLVGDYGTLPHAASGIRLSLGVEGRRWSGRLGFGALLPATKWVEGPVGTVGGRFWLGTGRVEGCVRATESVRTSLDGCLVFEIGTLMASGVGVDQARNHPLAWLAPGGRLFGSVPLGRRQARGLFGLEALVPLVTKDFTVENGGVKVYRPAPVVGRVDLGVGWQFE